MAKKVTGPEPVRCCDCANEEPVYNEFPSWDGTPVFCECRYIKHYRQRRWPQPCAHFVAKDETAENQRENK